MLTYIGFSTVSKTFPPYSLTDLELVKQDILNEFNTRMGERVMRPNFGTIIFDLLMDPGDDLTKDAVERDATRIVKKDPRVQLVNLRVEDVEDAILIDITLLWTPTRVQESLYISYQKSTGLVNQPRQLSSGVDSAQTRVR